MDNTNLNSPAYLKESKWAGLKNLIQNAQNTTKILQSNQQTSQKAAKFFEKSAQITQANSQRLNVTLFHYLSVPFQEVDLPSPSNSTVKFIPDALQNIGEFYDQNKNSKLGLLSSIKISSIDQIHRAYNSFKVLNQTFSSYSKPLKNQLASALTSYQSFDKTIEKLIKLATKNENQISQYVNKTDIALYIIISFTIIYMAFTLVCVICMAFYHDPKRMALLQLSWILLGSVMIILCVTASVFTIVVVSAGFPICNGYLALFDDQQKLINGSQNIDRQAGRVFRECLYGSGNVADGLLVTSGTQNGTNDNFNFTQYQQLDNVTKISRIDIRDYTAAKNQSVFVDIKTSQWFKLIDAYKSQVQFAIQNTRYASQRNPDNNFNSTYQFELLNRMTNSKYPNSYQQNCTGQLDDQIIEVQRQCEQNTYYTPPFGFFSRQDYLAGKKRCLLIGNWTIQDIKQRYLNYFQNCKITNQNGEEVSLGSQIVTQYRNYYEYRSQIKRNYQKLLKGLSKYQAQFFQSSDQIKQTFNQTSQYIIKMTPLLYNLQNEYSGLLSNTYKCQVITKSLQMVYNSGCVRLTPYIFTLVILLWVCTISVGVSVGMTVCFHRRAKVD